MTPFRPGDKVHYTSHNGKKENGIVKSIDGEMYVAWVVYHCNNEWDNYQDYTGALTNFSQLTLGWVEPKTDNHGNDIY